MRLYCYTCRRRTPHARDPDLPRLACGTCGGVIDLRPRCTSCGRRDVPSWYLASDSLCQACLDARADATEAA